MAEKRILEPYEETGDVFDLKRVKAEPVPFEFCANTCRNTYINVPPADDYMFDYDRAKRENLGWESHIWNNSATNHLNYHHFDNCYSYRNIYSSGIHQPFLDYRSYNRMTDVISFDSQDFLLQSDIDLLQSVEFEFPVQEDSDIPTEVTQIEIITAPTKRKRSTGVKKTQGSSGARRTTASSQYTTVPLPPCKVCGGVATGFHFGVITCEACKVWCHWLPTNVVDS